MASPATLESPQPRQHLTLAYGSPTIRGGSGKLWRSLHHGRRMGHARNKVPKPGDSREC
jgi:hypothetical protein